MGCARVERERHRKRNHDCGNAHCPTPKSTVVEKGEMLVSSAPAFLREMPASIRVMAPAIIAARAVVCGNWAIPGVWSAKAGPSSAADFFLAHLEAAQAAVLADALAARVQRTPRPLIGPARARTDEVRRDRSQQE